ncbi:M20 family metallopeptidase [Paraburkholderia solisilvae]|uniref:Succinyl-diaminopimelate desuccinylase n=1 Tax=Paraburkholderia solisilvae TaxID=624376 RepID=A0A6J5DVX6_9BURK|nr:M20/M25/M40 family metallo-hydrolase [Paraburkholderia solisilvae]CAB3757654.1 Succinyl-diaminopimelate desuccinylase [Paraburkholderia solisilvae]
MTGTFAHGGSNEGGNDAGTDARLSATGSASTDATIDPHSASIVALLTRLVRIPSRGGIDPTAPILECIEQWFAQHAPLLPRRRVLSADDEPLGLYVEVRGTAAASGRSSATREDKTPYYVLNATLDTAGFGDEQVWTHPPLAAHVADGWLYGRGAADSKAGAALFAHLLVALSQRRAEFAGRAGLLLDLDEHTGRFGGARAFFGNPVSNPVDNPVDKTIDNSVNLDKSDNRTPGAASHPRPDGVLIGYPGHERLMVGARGFLRARLVVHGVAAHSGSGSTRGLNAALRGAALAGALAGLPLPVDDDATFERPAQLTVTGIHAGDGGFTAVPDRCELTVDIRLTPRFDAQQARALLTDAIRAHDLTYHRSPANTLLTDIEWIDGWPAYRVPDTHPMVAALCAAAQHRLGAKPPCAVAGPSNIGNYLASLSVPALCGYGPRGEQLHATDERIQLSTLAPVYQIYEDTMLALLRH